MKQNWNCGTETNDEAINPCNTHHRQSRHIVARRIFDQSLQQLSLHAVVPLQFRNGLFRIFGTLPSFMSLSHLVFVWYIIIINILTDVVCHQMNVKGLSYASARNLKTIVDNIFLLFHVTICTSCTQNPENPEVNRALVVVVITGYQMPSTELSIEPATCYISNISPRPWWQIIPALMHQGLMASD